ncbi:membrane protein [Dyella thiooxydans]|uniref:Membrane protein n=1 Tax=Dyella thiooxydans TaxID=445710 RepID=A0A161JD21_9GAMM|nr:type IVB secretion system protein IcmH/DotU [Dyella thiooxydans]AND69055.1 membrane protein [Dyella thiooxydans]
MNTPNGPGHPPGYPPVPDDATIVRPRGTQPAAPAPASHAPPPAAPAYAPAPAAPAPRADISEFLGGGMNPLVQAAAPLLLLGVQLRHSVSPPDATRLREQVTTQVRRFESHANAAGLPVQTVTAARYVLCAMLDESVLNAPWGEQSGWAQKTLLVTFHGESYGGAKFFQILERLCADFSRHIDLIELMYLCLALGFGGRYQIEAGGRARLADIQEDLYRRIKAQRAPAADELAPHWRGIEDRRNPLIRYVPLWVIAAAAACVLLVAFLFFYTRLNTLSAPASAQIAQIGLESATPPDTTRLNQATPPAPHKTLKELLAPEAQAGRLEVIDQSDGSELVRLSGSDMFASGGVDVSAAEIPLLHQITAALNQVPGRVIVVGHTDDQPIHSLRFKDNFELSAARARAVVQILAQGLDNPARLESSGAGSSQPIALPPNLPANRTRNRRVEIKYIPEG